MVEPAKYILKNAKGSLFRYRSFNKNNIDALKRKYIFQRLKILMTLGNVF